MQTKTIIYKRDSKNEISFAAKEISINVILDFLDKHKAELNEIEVLYIWKAESLNLHEEINTIFDRVDSELSQVFYDLSKFKYFVNDYEDFFDSAIISFCFTLEYNHHDVNKCEILCIRKD